MSRNISILPNLLGVLAVSLYPVSPIAAQISPDRTVGSEVNSIDPATNSPTVDTQYIRGGRTRGTNLFHSFSEFNIDSGKAAYFVNPGSINTIFSRVTGRNPSLLFGKLGITGGNTNPNLFFINPNGIVFGRGATLDLNGSFVATTANNIKFPDGTEFSTINSQDAPLLTIETPVPIALEFVGDSPGAIINAGNISTLEDNSNIALVSGTILNIGSASLDFGTMLSGRGDLTLVTVPNGTNSVVELNNNGSFVSQSIIPFNNQANPGLSLSELVKVSELETGLTIADGDRIVLTDSGTSTLIPVKNGDIVIASPFLYGDNLTVYTEGADSSIIFKSSRDINLLNSGIYSYQSIDNRIDLTALSDINITDSKIATEEGSNNSINLAAKNIFLDSQSITTSIQTGNFAGGKSGDINLRATEQISLKPGINSVVDISSSPTEGKAGNINLEAPKIKLENASSNDPNGIRTSDSGSINLVGQDIQLLNFAIQNESNSTDNTGEINVKFHSLKLDGSTIYTTVTGGIQEPQKVSDINITKFDNNLNNLDRAIYLDNGSNIATSSPFGVTSGGNINVTTDNLRLSNDSSISAINTGDVTINATNTTVTNNSILSVNGFNISDNILFNSKLLNIVTDRLIVDNGGKISTEISTVEPDRQLSAGNIKITANSLALNNQGNITANTTGSGDSGKIDIYARNSVNVDNQSEISSVVTPESQGNSGQISIKTAKFSLLDGSKISTDVQQNSVANRPSNISIQANDLYLNNSQIVASTSGTGDAGDIAIGGGDRVNLQDNSLVSTTVNPGAIGRGGKVTISSNNINLNNSQIAASTSGKGDAGSINFNAFNNVTLAENSLVSTSVSEVGEGKGGDIDLSARSLQINSGSQLATNTESNRNIDRNLNNLNVDAGNITIAITDSIILDGKSSGFFASTGAESVGNGGNIFIDPAVFLIQNNAGVFANSQGQGKAGNIEIFAGDLTLNRGTISAQTLSSDGGNITLNVPNLVHLKNASRISATAGTIQAGGNGGKIAINAGFILANPLGDNDILANAFTGSGGSINIKANGIIGFQIQNNFRFDLDNNTLENPTPGLSEIVASSQFGGRGSIEISTLQIDPLTGLDTLPETTVNLQVSQGCNATNATKAAYFYLGRTGLPNNPDRLFSEEIAPAWIPWSSSSVRLASDTQTTFANRSSASPALSSIQATLSCP